MLLAASYLQLPYHVVMVVEPRVRGRSSCLFLGYHRMNQCNLTQYNDTSLCKIQPLAICIVMDITLGCVCNSVLNVNNRIIV